MTASTTVAEVGSSRWMRAGRAALPLLALFLALCAGRVVFISLYAESIPFWDQWDAEGANLLKPWLEGTLGWTNLLALHNEHRIFFTRLIALLVFEANDGQWDNLVSAYANVAVYAAVSTLLYVVLRQELESRLSRVALSVALVALAWIPYAYENTLVGFQNQFHLMGAFAIMAIACAAKADDSPRLLPWVVAAAVMGCFTMASGLLGGVAAAGVLLLRWWIGRLRTSQMLAGIALLAACTLLALSSVPHLPHHDALKAPDAASWLRATVVSLGWPLGYGWRTAWIVWLPTAIATMRLLLGRRASNGELIAFGLAAWVVLQAMAMGYSRGNGMLWPSSRYMDTLAVGVVVNLWFALRLLAVARVRTPSDPLPRIAGSSLVLALLVAAVGSALAMAIPADLATAQARLDDSIAQTRNVRRYVATGDRLALHQPPLQIPYPNERRLTELLDDRSLRSTLPATIRQPLPLIAGGHGSGFVVQHSELFSPSVTSCRPPDCVSAQGRWVSAPFTTTFPYVEVLANVHGPGTGLEVAAVSTSAPGPGKAGGLEGDAVSRLNLRTGHAPLQLVAIDASPRGSLGLHDVVETGRLSVLAAGVQDTVRAAFGRESVARRSSRADIESPFASPDANRPLPLVSGERVKVAWRAPQSVNIDRMAVQIGNYGGASDGTLTMTACTASGCATGRANLAGSLDNGMFELRLPRPWPVNAGEPLAFELSTAGATQPVVLWTYPASSDSAVVASAPTQDAGATTNRGLRLRLTYLRP